jgi:nucleoside-diphosphate kinase
MNKDHGKCSLEQTFGMIKPEGIARKLEDSIESRIMGAGLQIAEKKKVIMSDYQFSLLYGHVEQKQPEIYKPMKDYLTANPVIVLRIAGEDAVRKVLELRGSSNPADALPGTIRGDYAKDQDYNQLPKQGKPALNVFHASGSLEEAKTMLKEFFGVKE